MAGASGLVASVFLTLDLRIDKGRATSQRIRRLALWRGEKVLRELGMSRCHVAGVAGLQLVVQALHQFILGSGGDYASLQTTRILSRTLKEARRP